MAVRTRKHWGWGYADEQPSIDDVRAVAGGIVDVLGMGSRDVEAPVPLEEVVLREPRIAPPPALAEICDTGEQARASHAQGKSYVDVVRGFRGRFDHPPDVVARPRDEQEVEAVLEWAAAEQVAVIPYGGG